MRWPNRNEIYYLSLGMGTLAILFTILVVTWQLGRDMLAIGLSASSGAAFTGLYTFTVTRRLTEFGSRVASVCLVVGFVSGALLPLIPLDPIVETVLGFSLIFGIGAMGLVYLSFIEIPITFPKKPGRSRGDRLLDAGFLLIIAGSFIAFLRGFSLPISSELYSTFFSPIGLTGKVFFISGTLVFDVAVIRARKRFDQTASGP